MRLQGRLQVFSFKTLSNVGHCLALTSQFFFGCLPLSRNRLQRIALRFARCDLLKTGLTSVRVRPC